MIRPVVCRMGLQHDGYLGDRSFSKKAKKGKAATEEEEEVEEVDISNLVGEMEEGLNAIMDNYDKELAVIKTGRADPRILDKVRVKAYDDAEVQLVTVAQVSAPDPRTLLVNVFDPNIVSMVDKAIRGAGLDLNPTISGSQIKVPIPKVTQEGRKKLMKHASSLAEQTKIAIRRARQHCMDQIKKIEMSKDDLKKEEKEIQILVDKYIKLIEDKLQAKQTILSE